jgi:membrane-bound lytic murein transglycosylase D
MKKVIILLFLGIILNGCSTFYNLQYKIYKRQKDNTILEVVEEKKDENLELLKLKDMEIDSLYKELQTYQFITDSLYTALEIANSRVAVNKGFVIPDSIEFAGRIFDLSNERFYHRFQEIYKSELRSAHKFIPRSGKYFSYFDSVFSKAGIPLDAKYLAVAESGLSPLAGSRVGARGIWQFMPATAKGFGMRINDFIDDRQNVFISTEKAASLLKSNYNYLKARGAEDWLLAMCAYNAGAGSIARVVRKQGGNNFFDLIMQVDETNKYVWRAVAIKMIFENEEEIFGKKFEREEPIFSKIKIKRLELKGHYKIDEWAKYQGTNISQVWQLNPWIKIYERKRKRYSSVTDVVLPPGKYEIAVPINAVKNEEKLAQLEKKFQKKNAGYFTEHIVRKGDNLSKIAYKYKTTVKNIKSINGLTSNIIYPGQKLKLIGKPVKTTKIYVVKKGDSVGGIASKLGVKTTALIQKNKLKKKNNGVVLIYPGQKLYY